MLKKVFALVFALALLAVGGAAIYVSGLDKTQQARLLLSLAMQEGEALFQADEIDYAAPPPVLGWLDGRNTKSLNGQWSMIVDPMGVGTPGSIFGGYPPNRKNPSGMNLVEYNFDTAQKVNVPGDVNSQDPRLFFYRDKFWMYRSFDAQKREGRRTLLHFGAVNFTGTIFLNGQTIGQHKGGYVPFHFDITEHMRDGKNELMVWVDNRLDDATIPTGRTDWWPYGGLTRDVHLVDVPAAHIVNAKLALSRSSNDLIDISVSTTGFERDVEVSVKIAELDVSETLKLERDGTAKKQIRVRPTLWSPNNPKLYDVTISAGDSQINDRIGFRHIETRGEKIFLNGSEIRLRGISTHEEPIGEKGVAFSAAHAKGILEEAKALGVNFVRAAHYPYSRHMARMADEMGVMLWEEIPVYWQIDWDNSETLAIARDQMARLVQRDWNRASVIIWSVANETPNTKPRLKFLRRLIDDTRALDDTRLVSAALLGGSQPDFALIAARLAARAVVSPDVPDDAKKIFKACLTKLVISRRARQTAIR